MPDEKIITHIDPPHVPTARCIVCKKTISLHEAWGVFITRRTAITERTRRWQAWQISKPEDLWHVTESYWDPSMNVTSSWSGEIPAYNPTHISYTYAGHACCKEHAEQGQMLTPWEVT